LELYFLDKVIPDLFHREAAMQTVLPFARNENGLFSRILSWHTDIERFEFSVGSPTRRWDGGPNLTEKAPSSAAVD
jgi:hypothetical protein